MSGGVAQWPLAPANEANGPAAPVFFILPRFLPPTLFNRATGWMDDETRIAQNRAVYATVIEVFFCIGSLPLGSTRGGVARISLFLNVLFLILALLGTAGGLRCSAFLLIGHAFLVWSLLSLFVIYFIASTLASSEPNSEDNFILFLVFMFFAVDFVIAFFTFYCARALQRYKRRCQAEDAAAGGPGLGAGLTAAAAAVTAAAHGGSADDRSALAAAMGAARRAIADRATGRGGAAIQSSSAGGSGGGGSGGGGSGGGGGAMAATTGGAHTVLPIAATNPFEIVSPMREPSATGGPGGRGMGGGAPAAPVPPTQFGASQKRVGTSAATAGGGGGGGGPTGSGSGSKSGSGGNVAPVGGSIVGTGLPNEEQICPICLDRNRNAAFNDCGHTGCFECLTAMQQRYGHCFMCRRRIIGVIRIY